ncbi:MAG: RimK protein [Candidatus Saccharibacteria bacterium]|nr:RimK protein [Candidatus Saccharibacteria bacterium]
MSSPRQKTVIILSVDYDSHVDFMLPYLSNALLIDAQSIADCDELSYRTDNKGVHIVYRGKELTDVSGVWLRRPRTKEVSVLKLSVDPSYRDYSVSAILRHADALMSHFNDATWVSDPFAIQRANYKPFQLDTAIRLGFNVPATLFTSDAARAKEFVDKHKEVVFKPIAQDFPNTKKSYKALYTTRVVSPETMRYQGLNLAPTIFQQTIEPALDLRITVVDNKVFAAGITVDNLDESPRLDWRMGNVMGEMHIEPYTLPKEVSDKCVVLVKQLGLKFGAIDMILDKKGKFWFLEINPNGQWAFVEDVTGQPIAKALAELLETGKVTS